MNNAETVPIKRIRCPKCGLHPAYLVEFWRSHCIEFEVSADGTARAKEGYMKEGDPFYVQAECDCGHKWKLKGVSQITSLDVKPKLIKFKCPECNDVEEHETEGYACTGCLLLSGKNFLLEAVK